MTEHDGRRGSREEEDMGRKGCNVGVSIQCTHTMQLHCLFCLM